ncbi:MAG: hypothetical protein JWL77_6952 [Chthonomonadaceae bacterium]|nr:hypothetical protein [Chthonomonadaceae bacterium]
MGQCCATPARPTTDVKVEGNRCFQFRRCDCCDNDHCLSSCCVFKTVNITTPLTNVRSIAPVIEEMLK